MNVAYIYKTPGVYTQEVDAFPPSIVGIDTAVPAFIGYTETAQQRGRSLNLQPVRIRSMVEYSAMFGGPYQHFFKLNDATNKPNHDVMLDKKPYTLDLEKRFLLYNSLQLFYANGGGDCYVVSVGTYDNTPLLKAD